MKFIDELELEAEKIRTELGEQFSLSSKQISALPTIKQLEHIASIAVQGILPNLFQSTMSPEDKDWLENGPKSNNLSDALKELTPPREIELSDGQWNQFEILNQFGGFQINLLFGSHDPFAPSDQKAANQDREERKQRVLAAYKEFCVALIDFEHKKSPMGQFLSTFFPMPTEDAPKPKREAKTAVRQRRPKLDKELG